MTMNRAQVVALLVAKVGFGVPMAIGLSTMAHAEPSGETVTIHHPAVQVSEIDYMSDGSIFATEQGQWHHEIKGSDDQWRDVTEADSQWSCVDDGNQVCGPNNTEGQPAGCYDDGGVLVAQWPCHVQDIGKGATDIVADPGSPQYNVGQTYN